MSILDLVFIIYLACLPVLLALINALDTQAQISFQRDVLKREAEIWDAALGTKDTTP